MLALFLFSATPKQFLHDLLANHQEESVSLRDHTDPVLHAAGFHCDCKYPVVHVPFTDAPVFDLPPAPITWLQVPATEMPELIPAQVAATRRLRGPPALA